MSRSKERKRKHDSSRSGRSRSKSKKMKKSTKKSRSRRESSSNSRHSSSSSDGSALPESVKNSLQLKQNDKEQRRKQKEALKAGETQEEKRARRVAKKEQKEMRRRQLMGWDTEHSGYTNQDNPFGDANLLANFVWKKKDEILESSGITEKPTSTVSRIEELEKVKKRRLEREAEKAMRQEAVTMEQRERERDYFALWESQEDSFHLKQAKLRSTIRIQDGRAKPIDLLAKYISTEDMDQLAVEMNDPQKFIQGLGMRDLDDLLEDIKVYIELEQGRNAEYWRDITIVVHDEMTRLNVNSHSDDVVSGSERDRMNESVASEVTKVFKGKTEDELEKLKTSIELKLKTQTNIDINYWEGLLRRLTAHMARVRLSGRHQEALRQKLYKLKHEQGVECGKPLFPSVSDQPQNDTLPKSSASPEPTIHVALSRSDPQPSPSASSTPPAAPVSKLEFETVAVGEDYDSGRYSPRLLQPSELPAGTVLLDPTEELEKIEFARKKYLGTGSAEIDADTTLMRKARESIVDAADADEGDFSAEHTLSKAYLWADKYRPRKPRYLNRVHTGYEWNKYNQTHYDPENPPPKIVQGYKFNIFYPDLIDKRQTPRFEVKALPDEPDFCILRFSSGPPYEDIAFKIVNREWEYGHKHGYRCQYANDIFQLWFRFKTYKYRR